jgi:hypothetical protein
VDTRQLVCQLLRARHRVLSDGVSDYTLLLACWRSLLATCDPDGPNCYRDSEKVMYRALAIWRQAVRVRLHAPQRVSASKPYAIPPTSRWDHYLIPWPLDSVEPERERPPC